MPQVKSEAEHAMLYRIVTTLFLFIILLQWIMPWIVTNDWLQMFTPPPIILAIAVSLFIGLLRLPSIWNILFSVLLCLILLLWIFSGESGQAGFSLNAAIDMFFIQLKGIISNGIWSMSEQQRTLLLVIGWVMLAPAIQAMIWFHQLSISILGATIVYLTLLHISFGMDVFTSMLLTIICGVALIAVTALPRLRRRLMIHSAWRGLKWNTTASIVIFMSVIAALAFAATFEKEREQKPLPIMTTMSTQLLDQLGVLSQQASGTPLHSSDQSAYSSALSGFSEDDSVLGLPLKTNNAPLFTGWSTEKAYWRADAKSFYDGRGWLDEEQPLVLRAISSKPEEIEQLLAEKEVKHGRSIIQQIEYIEPLRGMPFLQAGQYGIITQITAADPKREIHNYIANEQLDTLLPPTDELLVAAYEVTSWLPEENIRQLSELVLEREIDRPSISRLWEGESLEPYLQLPEQLPARVSALASEISGGGITSQYDRVKAIEQYLKNNYTYKLDSQLPKAGEDFVDHFLFQQQAGYCVHFSSAMVIMLRAEQIPARWVKGFTSGKAIEERTNEAGITEVKYEVSQANAHAWVEVYFPTVGWVPFDPTPQADVEGQPLLGSAQSLLSSAQQLWTQSVGNISKLFAVFASFTWIHAALGISILAAIIITMLLVKLCWNSRYQWQYARQYRRYRKFNEQQSEYLATQTAVAFPPRSKASFKQIEKQSKILLALQDSFCQYTANSLQISQIASVGIASPTWREHIALISDKQTVEQQQRLQIILNELERLHYAANGLQSYEWPVPKYWNKLLKLISAEQKVINKKTKGNTWRMMLLFNRR